jgi:hypothetical protein
VYPTLVINDKAQDVRRAILDQKRRKIRRLRDKSTRDEISERDRLHTKVELQKTQAEFNNYKNVHLYPLSVDIIIKLFTSVLLPIVLFVASNFLI